MIVTELLDMSIAKFRLLKERAGPQARLFTESGKAVVRQLAYEGALNDIAHQTDFLDWVAAIDKYHQQTVGITTNKRRADDEKLNIFKPPAKYAIVGIRKKMVQKKNARRTAGDNPAPTPQLKRRNIAE